MEEKTEEKDYMFLDKNGNKVNKDDWVDISGHENPSVNGLDYICLRMWQLGSEEKVECLKDINGIVKHVVVNVSLVEKQL